MNDLILTQIVASEKQTCFQCFNIGLPILGIAQGEACMLIEGPTMTKYACMDCFNRLNEEIEKIKDEESDIVESDESEA